MSMRYRVQFTTDRLQSLSPDGWHFQKAKNPEDAAIAVMRRTNTVPNAGQSLFVNVALPAPLHANGQPMICHTFDMRLPEEAAR